MDVSKGKEDNSVDGGQIKLGDAVVLTDWRGRHDAEAGNGKVCALNSEETSLAGSSRT